MLSNNDKDNLPGTAMIIDVTRLADRLIQGRLPTGVDRVSLAYLRRFRDRACALVRFLGRWIELDEHDSQRLFDALLGDCKRPAWTLRKCVGRGYALSWHRHRNALLLNTGHSGLDREDYRREVERRGLRPVFFLHDLIPLTHPEFCRPGEAERHQRRLQTMLSTGRGLIMNSVSTRNELHAYASALGSPLPPSIVAPLAPASLPPPESKRPLDAPYFVMLGTIEPRKNHLLLLHLWRDLVQEIGSATPRLVVIGQRGWECEQVVDLLDRCQALQGIVLEKPRCEDAELATWLSHAQALLFPSFTEGFGIPLIEALMLGVPVIASDLPVFREIAGEIPDYLHPLDGLGWKQRILDYVLKQSPTRQAQCLRMRGFRVPTWEAHFALVEELLRDVRGQP